MNAPLHGITVVDLTHVLAGPFASASLRDLGARVIKVERPGTGDDTRAFPPFKDGESAYFAALNHGKQSLALDLKAEADRATFDRLLARADVVLENFRPGTMERLGYGWADLHPRFPRLIYGAVSGFGHTGPEAGKPAYDMVVQARGGVMSITGEEGGPPVRVGASVGDIVAGGYPVEGGTGARSSSATAPARAPRSTSRCWTGRSRSWNTPSPSPRRPARRPVPPARGIRRSRPSRPSAPRTGSS